MMSVTKDNQRLASGWKGSRLKRSNPRLTRVATRCVISITLSPALMELQEKNLFHLKAKVFQRNVALIILYSPFTRRVNTPSVSNAVLRRGKWRLLCSGYWVVWSAINGTHECPLHMSRHFTDWDLRQRLTRPLMRQVRGTSCTQIEICNYKWLHDISSPQAECLLLDILFFLTCVSLPACKDI